MKDLAGLKKKVCSANKKLPDAGLVTLTWGNAGGLDKETGRMVIKPSGVPYEELNPDNMVVLSLENGEKCEGAMKASSDAPTHLELYRAFPSIGGIVHTHSLYATAWAQAEKQVPCLGTTHADTFYGPVPVCRQLRAEEVEADYEINVGKVIGEHFAGRELDPLFVPGVLVPGHGPFAWGEDVDAAVKNAIVLEEVSKMAYLTLNLEPGETGLPGYILNKHFSRKHGPDAYYGQK